MSEFVDQKQALIAGYRRSYSIVDPAISQSFMRVPREMFLPADLRKFAYVDRPLPLFKTGATISAPHMCFLILSYLQLSPGLKVLEVGTGSGYQAALIAEMVAPTDETSEKRGHVFTIECISPLIPFAKKNFREAGYSDRVSVREGDGTLGWPEEALFDRIILTAAGPQVPPPLIEQLKPGGMLSMPRGGQFSQEMILVRKNDSGELTEIRLGGVRFVPLRGKYGVK